MHNLALLYREQGRVKLRPLPSRAPMHPPVEIIDYFEKAIPFFQKALEIREAVLGPDDEDVAESLADLAVCYQLQGRNKEAEPLASRSDAIKFEQGTLRELKLLRELMTEGQGVVQQELDHHRGILDQFSKNLSQNKREAIRHSERLQRLQRKYREEVAAQDTEVSLACGEYLNRFLTDCSMEMPYPSMRHSATADHASKDEARIRDEGSQARIRRSRVSSQGATQRSYESDKKARRAHSWQYRREM